MQLPQRLIDKDDRDVILCVLKMPIFVNFCRKIVFGSFPRNGKTCFFHYGSAPYRQLMENPKSYVCRGPFSKSLREVSGKLNVPIFIQMRKRETVMHYKCPLADEIGKSGSVSTPGLGQ